MNRKPNGNPEITLNWITPHQKWGIHSTYSDNLLMLTLSRGGPIIWLSEHDAAKAGIVDNDWVEVFNADISEERHYAIETKSSVVILELLRIPELVVDRHPYRSSDTPDAGLTT